MYLWRKPAPPLDEWIECLWLIADEPTQTKERIVPSSTVDIGINLHEDRIRVYDAGNPERFELLSGAAVSGPRSQPIVIAPRELVSVMGVRFKVAGAFPFLGVPTSELVDTPVNLEAVWAQSATELRERLCSAKTSDERFGLLEKALLAQVRRPLERHYAVQFALDAFERSDSGWTVRDLARAVGLSQRRFIEVFTREVGLSPKLFGRVRRFRQTLEKLRHTTIADWARLAAEGGYYDQSHLIHEFRFFSNLSPTEFLCQRSECVVQNHATAVR